MNSEKNQKIVKLLWTGGWDSSFRLLQLVLILKKKVQPYYIMDPERSSLGYELRAMQNVKSRLFKDQPELRDRIQPTKYIEKNSIPINKEIEEARERLKENAPFGDQYLWLSSFAFAAGLKGLELGAEHATGERATYVNNRLIKTKEDGISFYMIDEKFADTDIYKLFHYYRFPIREISKLDMRDIARQNGFYHVMELTWFCHHPRRNGKQCGFCTPCTQAYQEGMSFRLPFSSKLRYHVRWFYNLDQFKKCFPRCYQFLSSIKRSILKFCK